MKNTIMNKKECFKNQVKVGFIELIECFDEVANTKGYIVQVPDSIFLNEYEEDIALIEENSIPMENRFRISDTAVHFGVFFDAFFYFNWMLTSVHDGSNPFDDAELPY